MDIDTIQTLLIKAAVFAPIMIGIVQVVKISGMPVRWLPLSSLVIGVAFGLIFVQFGVVGALCGMVLGLSAVGLYEFGTRTSGAKG